MCPTTATVAALNGRDEGESFDSLRLALFLCLTVTVLTLVRYGKITLWIIQLCGTKL